MTNGVFSSPKLKRLRQRKLRLKGYCLPLRTLFKDLLIFYLIPGSLSLFLWLPPVFAQEWYEGMSGKTSPFLVSSNPPGASVVLKGEESIFGTAPLSISNLKAGFYKVRLSKNGYETQTGGLTIFENEERILTAKFNSVSRRDVLLRSALLSGWGQFHLGDRDKGIVFSVVQVGAVAASLLMNLEYERALDELDASVERYKSATNITDIKQFRQEMTRKYEDADDAYNSRQIALGFASAVWLVNVLDAALLSSGLKADTSTAGSIVFDMLPKSRLKAALRSMLLPGWGQFYSGRRDAGIFWGLSGLTSTVVAILNRSDYHRAVNKFERVREKYMSATAIEDIEKYREEMSARRRDADEAFRYHRLSLGLLIGVWAYNVLDCMITFEQSSSPSHRLISLLKRSPVYVRAGDGITALGIECRF